jgi:hypothetical protein
VWSKEKVYDNQMAIETCARLAAGLGSALDQDLSPLRPRLALSFISLALSQAQHDNTSNLGLFLTIEVQENSRSTPKPRTEAARVRVGQFCSGYVS